MYHMNSSELIVSNTYVVKFWVTLDLSIFAYPRFDLQKNHYARFLCHYYSVCARRPIRTHMNVHIMPISIYPMFGLRVILWIMEKIVKIYYTCESFFMNNNICVSTKWRRPIKCFYLLKVSALRNSSQKIDIFKVDVNDLNIENRCLHFHSTLHKVWNPWRNLIGKMFR